jgi:hypothetical protein
MDEAAMAAAATLPDWVLRVDRNDDGIPDVFQDPMMLMMMADEPMAEESTVVTNVREIRDANGDLTVITTTTTTTGDVESVDVKTEYFLADGTQVEELPTPEEETTTPDEPVVEETTTPDEPVVEETTTPEETETTATTTTTTTTTEGEGEATTPDEEETTPAEETTEGEAVEPVVDEEETTTTTTATTVTTTTDGEGEQEPATGEEGTAAEGTAAEPATTEDGADEGVAAEPATETSTEPAAESMEDECECDGCCGNDVKINIVFEVNVDDDGAVTIGAQ